MSVYSIFLCHESGNACESLSSLLVCFLQNHGLCLFVLLSLFHAGGSPVACSCSKSNQLNLVRAL